MSVGEALQFQTSTPTMIQVDGVDDIRLPDPNGHLASQLSKRQCSTCGRVFLKTDHLERHIRSHTKERPYACTICGRRYGRSDTLIRHETIHHRDNPDRASVLARTAPKQRKRLGQRHGQSYQGRPSPTDETTRSHSSPSPTSAIPSNVGEAYPFDTRAESDLPVNNYGSDSGIPTGALQMPETVETSTTQLTSALTQDFQLQHAVPCQMPAPTDSELNRYAFPQGHSMSFDFEPGGLLWEDVDLGDLNSYFLEPSAALDGPSQSTTTRTDTERSTDASQNRNSPNEAAAIVEQLWFTRLENDTQDLSSPRPDPGTGTATPRAGQSAREDLNEGYRLSLTNRLRANYTEEPLPSTDFLKLCLQMYFNKCNTIFPIFHAPTFRLTQENGFLLLSLCAIGCLFVGTEEATHYGGLLFERLFRTIMTSWDVITATHAEEKIPIVQSALIGQLFMMLSGKPRHLAIASAFHGTLISWTRRAELMSVKHEHIDLEDLSEPQLASLWRRWARKEELLRTALAVFIQDADLAALFHHEPILRYGGKDIPVASSSEAFAAPTVGSWVQVMKKEPACRRSAGGVVGTAAPSLRYQMPNAACAHSEFSAYTILACMGAAICEDRVGDALSAAKAKTYETDLIRWYEVFGKTLQADFDPQCLLLLWHWTFISNLVDLNRLELAAGKKGPARAAACADYVDGWASSVESKRCLVHAHLLQRNMEGKCLRRPLAIHVPRCLFSAAICWAMFFGSNENRPALDVEASLDHADFPELRMLGVDLPRHWSNTIGVGNTNLLTVKGNTLCALAELLRQVGHWEIARRFSRILRPLIHGSGDEALLSR